MFIFSFFLLSLENVYAQTFYDRDVVIIQENETIDDDIFVRAKELTIRGKVLGNVFVVAQNINISGSVLGSIYAFGSNVDISGSVSENVITASSKLRFQDARVGNSVIAAASYILFDKESFLNGSFLHGAGDVDLQGTVSRGIFGWSGRFSLSGKVDKDVRLSVSELVLQKGAEVKGNLHYFSSQPASIEGGALVGSIKRIFPETLHFKERLKSGFHAGFQFWQFFSSLLVGLFVLFLAPKQFEYVSSIIEKKPWHTILAGFFILIFLPIFAFLLLFTIIGIPLGIVFFVSYFLGWYFAKIFFGYFIGQHVFTLFGQENVRNYWFLALGLFIYYVLRLIPVLGGFVFFLTLLFGLGSLFMLKKAVILKLRKLKI